MDTKNLSDNFSKTIEGANGLVDFINDSIKELGKSKLPESEQKEVAEKISLFQKQINKQSEELKSIVTRYNNIK